MKGEKKNNIKYFLINISYKFLHIFTIEHKGIHMFGRNSGVFEALF